MLEPEKQCDYDHYYYYNGIGNYGGEIPSEPKRKYVIVQSLWTKPIKSKERLEQTLYIAALSLAYAHRSGYKVHMHTDSYGLKLMKDFGYDKIFFTLDKIPASVPTELFAAGKFFAMNAEGRVGKIHMDIDVFIKKPHLLDTFYTNKEIDVICQNEEDYSRLCHYEDKIRSMCMLGYPASTRPDWQGSMNTGVIGFNSRTLANKYINNYFLALDMYTKEKFDEYKEKDDNASMTFDFILEQVNLSHMSIGYNVRTLVPMHNPSKVADWIGYQHLQGSKKWGEDDQKKIRTNLLKVNSALYNKVRNVCRILKK